MNGDRRAGRGPWTAALLGMVLVGSGLVTLVLWLRGTTGRPAAATRSTAPIALSTGAPLAPATTVRERLIPTAGGGARPSVAPPSTRRATDQPSAPHTATPRPPATAVPGGGASPTAGPAPELFMRRQRIGFSAPQGNLEPYDVAALAAGWYLTGETRAPAGAPPDLEFVPLVEVLGSEFSPGLEELRALAARQPGALWLVGNEPDVAWQDDATPEQYAQVYHDVYAALKAADPTCQVAIGGVAQITPLRLRYLDSILATYQKRYGQPMPVDVWNVHLAILREERGSWGVDIPPGLVADQGVLYEVADNANVEIFKSQVRTLRTWMAERGFRDQPLIVTEFSVLMPPEYGFDEETVRSFMVAAFDFLLTATDAETGCPADGNRLVQRAAWYSLADTVYATGNLFDPRTGQITPLGLALAAYAAGR